MKMRVCILAIGLAVISIPAHAQIGPGNSVPSIVREVTAMAQELSMLKARVAKLESGQIVASDLVGRYSVQMFGVEMGANPYVATEAGAFTMTLHADGTGEFSTSGSNPARCQLQWTGKGSVTCGD